MILLRERMEMKGFVETHLCLFESYSEQVHLIFHKLIPDSWFLKCVSRFAARVAALCLWGLNAKTDNESAPLIWRTSCKHSAHIDLSFITSRLHLETGVLCICNVTDVPHARMHLLMLFTKERVSDWIKPMTLHV